MGWTSIAAIYFLFFVMSAFVMLPFGVRTLDDLGAEDIGPEKVPGQADSAPIDFRPGKVAARASVVAALATTAFVLNYSFGWITVEDIDILPKPPGAAAR